MTHTPTPWEIFKDSETGEVCGSAPGVESASGESVVCFGELGWDDGCSGVRGDTPEVALANARLIVTAVNHHADMIELLSECFDQLGGMDGQIGLRARIMATLASVKEAQS